MRQPCESAASPPLQIIPEPAAQCTKRKVIFTARTLKQLSTNHMIQTLEWTDQGVRFIDQTKLPTEEVYVTCTTHQQVAEVIRNMVVRGAPAIGVAAAMGVALESKTLRRSPPEISSASSTTFANSSAKPGQRRSTCSGQFEECRRNSSAFAFAQFRRSNRALLKKRSACTQKTLPRINRWARHGATLMPSSGGVLTHCNAGALATAGYGTALGVIRAAVEQGKKIHVYADETRPFLQGSRLTAWELMKDGIPTTVISDNMAGAMMKQGKIGAIVVGADRIAANGDVANKIGTYTVAVLAKEHGIPFYVAAPISTVDLECPGRKPNSHRAAKWKGGHAHCRQADN